MMIQDDKAFTVEYFLFKFVNNFVFINVVLLIFANDHKMLQVAYL